MATPEVLDALNDVNGRLTSDELRDLNAKVTVTGLSPEYVAAKWAADQGLIPGTEVPDKPSPTPATTKSPTPTPTSSPSPSPSSSRSSDAGGSGAGYRNRGEPSSAAKSQNWDALAQCESGGDPTIVSSGGSYHGLYQFSVSTWQAMGGSGVPSDASAAEQTSRAQLLWDQSGPGQWPACGKNL